MCWLGQVRMSAINTRRDEETRKNDRGQHAHDNLSREEVLPDEVVGWLKLLDKKQKIKTGGCGRNFAAATGASKASTQRGGLMLAVGTQDEPLISLVLPLGEGERYVYHYILFLAAVLRGKYTYGTLDIACMYESWLERIDARTCAAMASLRELANEAGNAGVSLRAALAEAAVDGELVHWMAEHVSCVAAAINETTDKSTNDVNNVTPADVINVWRGLVFLLEVCGGVDVDDAASVASWPKVSLAGWRVVLNAMHAYAHGDVCRQQHDPRGVLHAGRSGDGEGVERVNAYFAAFIGRAASSRIDQLKQMVATSTRHIQNAKVKDMAKTIYR
jgi:hypothetical protein